VITFGRSTQGSESGIDGWLVTSGTPCCNVGN
jgi:hypothetical protein